MHSQQILDIALNCGMEPSDVVTARSMSAGALEELTLFYTREPLPRLAQFTMKAVKDLAAPYLIAALREPDAFQNIAGSRESPGSRALQMLPPGEYEDLKPVLREWIARGERDALRKIGQHVTSYGSDDFLPEARALLEHPDNAIASWARGGALHPLKNGTAGTRFKAYLWDHSLQLLHSPQAPEMYDPVRLMVLINRDRTTEALLEPAVMRPEHPLLPIALSTLNTLKTPAPADFLVSLIAAFVQPLSSRQIRIQKAALSGLLLHGHPEASGFVEEVLGNPASHHEDIVLAAWNARFRLAALVPFYEKAYEAYERAGNGIEDLSPDHRAAVLLDQLGAEIINGGFWQWYFNSGGQDAEEIHEALERIGARSHAEVMAAAIQLFGPGGPPEEDGPMRERMAATPDAAAKVNDLNGKWYDLPWWRIAGAKWDWDRQDR